MLNRELARQLVEAGLPWNPAEHDMFMIPDAGFDQKVFIISESTAQVQRLAGVPHITFHGSSEWALDHIRVGDVIWLPNETQLRLALEERRPNAVYVLERRPEGYRCLLANAAGNGQFHASAEDAYAVALLHVLRADADRPSEPS
ncbi:MAG: pilus assembly protein CpaE [Chloroflexota bacterium]|nr:pilus assembly protein CpaE [Chloroflexota bacterium]